LATATEIKTSIGHGFRGLIRLRGRDSRILFWPYAIAILSLYMFATLMALVPIILGTMARMQNLAREHPEDFVVRQQPGSYQITYIGNDPDIAAQMLPDMETFLTLSTIGNLIFALLLIAATVRRLHDRSVSGKWLLIPALAASVSLALFVPMMAEAFDMTGGQAPAATFLGRFAAVFILNMIYLISLVLLLVQLVQAGGSTENRYGAPSSI
jgi:uncharacterized membrane protein YhaH (DUF805 family)